MAKKKKSSPDPMAEARRRIAKARETGSLDLDLSKLGLTALPPEIGALTALQELALNDNQLTAVPPEIGSLVALKVLSLNDNQLTTLPPKIAELKYLQRLWLENNRLTTLLPGIGELKALSWLSLNNNHLTNLPKEIGALAELVVLLLDDNRLAALPPEIGAAKSLGVLSIRNNHLSDLPPEIGTLMALEFLLLSNNHFATLPSEIGALTALRALHLADNQFTTLSPEICALTSLQQLSLRNNQLTYLPPEIGALTSLDMLGLEYNQLTNLPQEISNLTALRALDIEANPLPQSYFNALDIGIESLFTLLRSLEDDTTPLYEAKLLITGEGNVGKSWALAALRGDNPHEYVGQGNTTWGIDRGELPLPHPEEPDCTLHLNTWDFGGQAVYRVTHQFFFSEQAIFLLVWNPREGVTKCRVREWLRTIALRTGSDVPRNAPPGTEPKPRARVIMVATHAEAEGGNYNPEYGHDSLDADLQAIIVGAIEVDSSTGYNIGKLREIVARHAAALPEMGTPFNTNWAAARNAVLDVRGKHPWITFGRFSEICAEHGVTETADQRALAGIFMNRLGRAVWYGPGAGESVEDTDALLADTFVLDAVWLSRAFVQVLEDKATRSSGGMLDHRRFPDIWTEHGRDGWHRYAPEEYQRISRIMRKFDVALPTQASAGERSLVPQLVPAIRPDLPWTEPKDAPGNGLVRLASQLDYQADGLMARFIAASEPHHVYEEGKGLFWQDGIFLRDSSSFNNEAVVSVEGKEKPYITLTVSGDQPGFLMNELHRTLESVTAFWKGLTRTDYILCPTRHADDSYCRGRFKFDTVLRRAAKETVQELDCQECDREWTPAELLHGLQAVRERREADRHLGYLYHHQKTPCPRAFLLRPADPKWHKITSWSSFAGKRFRITLVSELSGKPVGDGTEFTVKEEWTKWLGPLTRISSLLLTGLAVPLDGDIATQLSEGAAAMDKLGSLPAEDGDLAPMEDPHEAEHGRAPVRISDEQIHQLNTLLQAIGLDPRASGMDLAETRDGNWLWMTTAEAKAHERPEARFEA